MPAQVQPEQVFTEAMPEMQQVLMLMLSSARRKLTPWPQVVYVVHQPWRGGVRRGLKRALTDVPLN